MGDSDEVNVVYDQSDFRALYRACRRCKRNAALLVIFLPLLFGTLSYIDGRRGPELLYDVIPYLLIASAVVIAVYVIGPWLALRTRRKYGWNEPIAVKLSEQGIATRHPNQDSLFHWSKIREVTVRGQRLFLFTTPSCAIILPERCFPDQQQFTEWVDRAFDFWRTAKGGGVGPNDGGVK